MEKELHRENEMIKLKNHSSLLKEYRMVEALFKEKQLEFQQLKRDCLSSLQLLQKISPSEKLTLENLSIN